MTHFARPSVFAGMLLGFLLLLCGCQFGGEAVQMMIMPERPDAGEAAFDWKQELTEAFNAQRCRYDPASSPCHFTNTADETAQTVFDYVLQESEGRAELAELLLTRIDSTDESIDGFIGCAVDEPLQQSLGTAAQRTCQVGYCVLSPTQVVSGGLQNDRALCRSIAEEILPNRGLITLSEASIEQEELGFALGTIGGQIFLLAVTIGG